MRILHIINNLGSGGAEKLIESITPIMNQYQYIDVEVLILDDKNNVFDNKLLENEIKLSVVPIRKMRNPMNIFYIRNFILKGEFDIVHAHLFPTNYWTSFVSKTIFKNKPIFITTEHSTHNKRRDKWYFRSIEKYIYNNYDKIISISQETQDNLITWLKINNDINNKFTVIENGIDLKKFTKAIPYKKKEINKIFNEDTILLCMVGRFNEQKDQSTIIKTIKELPNNIHLLLIGEGELKKYNENLADVLGVSDRVHFLGFRNDIDRILKSVDIVILSSKWEGFGLAAVEGMAAGKPVIVTKVPGLSRIVNGAGLTFEVGNIKELKEKILILLNEEVYKEISDKCLLRSKKYSIEKMVEKYLEEYKKLRADIDG